MTLRLVAQVGRVEFVAAGSENDPAVFCFDQHFPRLNLRAKLASADWGRF
jgi:hypothetical protein